jgi:hypothetical protein
MLVLLMRSSRSGILSKGGKLPPGSVRVWGGVKYVKTAPGKWRRLVAEKEPWDSSDEKAKELKISDFGTPEEVREMAKPIRTANNRNEALVILKEIRQSGTLENRKNHALKATISGDSMSKLVSGKALHESFAREAHWLAIANVDKLFTNAIEPWKFELNPNKNNQDLKERRLLFAPLEYRNTIIPVKLTVKEFNDAERGIRLYSVEAVDAILDKK